MFYAEPAIPGPRDQAVKAALHDAAAIASIVANEFHTSYNGPARAEYLRVLGDYETDLGGRLEDGPTGLLAAFEGRRITIRFGPMSGAARCALRISRAVRGLGLAIRADLHTGECEIIDGKVGGLTVSIGARVAALQVLPRCWSRER
jgi:hypothetical protein